MHDTLIQCTIISTAIPFLLAFEVAPKFLILKAMRQSAFLCMWNFFFSFQIDGLRIDSQKGDY